MESWTQKIYTLSGMIRASIFGGKKVLDVGCGQRKLPGATGMDILANSAADTVHDMNKTPWPFADNAFDIIFMHHALEHADDIGEMLKEVYRIGSPGSRIIIQVPYFRSVDAFCDPTHKHFFTSESLDYFIEGAGLTWYRYTSFHFKKIGFWYGWPHPSRNPLRQLLKTFVHRYPNFYDQYLSLLLPSECVTWELEVPHKK